MKFGEVEACGACKGHGHFCSKCKKPGTPGKHYHRESNSSHTQTWKQDSFNQCTNCKGSGLVPIVAPLAQNRLDDQFPD